MKKFKFKLAQVLKYRVLLENIARSAYQEALSELNSRKAKLFELENKIITIRKGLNIKKGERVEPQTFEFVSYYIKQLSFLIKIQEELIDQQEEVAKKKLEDWTNRKRDSKVIKNLEEKKRREYIIMSEREEQKFLDDIFLARKNGDIRNE